MKSKALDLFVTTRLVLAQFCSAGVGNLLFAICLVFCTLGLGVSASAQEAAPALNSKEVVLHKSLNPRHGVDPAAGAIRFSASAQEAAPALNSKEVVLHNFVSPPHGAYPATGVIRDPAGNLYGTTNGAYSDIGGGGAHNAGVVFKVDTWGNQTVLYSFTGGADGSSPNGLIRDFVGNLYGTASGGGASFAGVVFKVDTLGNETVLYSFTGGADGGNPDSVIRDFAGNLYGTTNFGGASGAGVVFKVDPSGHETVLYSFTGGADGGNPYAGVIFGPGGNLYGTTAFGGAAGLGVVFKLNAAGQETVLHTFMRGLDGDQPFLAGLILDSLGNLYGTTAFGGAGGIGVVYKLDGRGNETVLYAFPAAADGQYPYNNGVILGSDRHLYGTTFYGGSNGKGVVYRLVDDGNEKVLYSLEALTADGFGQPTGGVIRDSAGNLYGTTFIGQTDVGYGYGVVYKVDTAGRSTVLHNFTDGADGGLPYGGVIIDSKGNLYGTASGGGASDAGVVFKIDTFGNETVLYSFTGGADGGGPFGSLIRDSAGNLYGTTNGGGTSFAGVVFKVDTLGHETVLYSFTGGADGGFPLAGVIRDSAGNFYGTTNGGGASGAGVVFKIDTSGNETALYSFTGGSDGGFPLWVVLARDSAGDLYGTTAGGGAAGAGVVFKVDASGQETVLHTFTGGSDGGTPFVGVVLGPDGNLYGNTAFGGQTNAGVVFEIKP